MSFLVIPSVQSNGVLNLKAAPLHGPLAFRETCPEQWFYSGVEVLLVRGKVCQLLLNVILLPKSTGVHAPHRNQASNVSFRFDILEAVFLRLDCLS